jgi:hypothetical protein
MKKSTKIIVIIGGSILLFLITKSLIEGYRIDNYGKTIIGKYIYSEKGAKRQSDYFLYYINGKKNIDSQTVLRWDSKDEIDHFFYMKYLDEFPGVIHPMLDKEVTDTLEILKAGFSREDLTRR